MRRPRSRLSIAELLVMVAFAALVLQVWRTWRADFEREEHVLLLSWLAAWMVGVLAGRMIGWTSILPAVLTCGVATYVACRFLRLDRSVQFDFTLVSALLALVTSPLSQFLVFCGHKVATWLATPGRARQNTIGAAFVLACVVIGVWRPWIGRPVSGQVFEQLVDPSRVADQPSNPLRMGAVAPKGESIAVYLRWKAMVLNAKTGEVRTLNSRWPLQPLAYSHDGRWLAVLETPDVEQARIALYDVPGLQEQGGFEVPRRPASCRFRKDGTLQLSFALDFQRIQFETWQFTPEVKRVDRWEFDVGPNATTGPYSADGALALVHPREQLNEDLPRQLWNLHPPRMIAELPSDITPNYVAVGTPLFHSGDWIATGGMMWHRPTGAHRSIESGTKAGVRPGSEEFVVVLRSYEFVTAINPTWSKGWWKRDLRWELRAPFYRLQFKQTQGARLSLVRPRGGSKAELDHWYSAPLRFEELRGGIFCDAAMAPDGSAVAALDCDGRILLWRFHRALLRHEFQRRH